MTVAVVALLAASTKLTASLASEVSSSPSSGRFSAATFSRTTEIASALVVTVTGFINAVLSNPAVTPAATSTFRAVPPCCHNCSTALPNFDESIPETSTLAPLSPSSIMRTISTLSMSNPPGIVTLAVAYTSRVSSPAPPSMESPRSKVLSELLPITPDILSFPLVPKTGSSPSVSLKRSPLASAICPAMASAQLSGASEPSTPPITSLEASARLAVQGSPASATPIVKSRAAATLLATEFASSLSGAAPLIMFKMNTSAVMSPLSS